MQLPWVGALVGAALVGSLLVGCVEDQTPASLIDRTRVLAAEAAVVGEPDQVYPGGGQTAAVDLTVVGFDPAEGITWLIYACRAAPVRGGIPSCAFGVSNPEDGSFRPVPIFDPLVDDGDTVDDVDPDAFLLEFRQDDRTDRVPTVAFRLDDPVVATAQQDCPSPDAPEGLGFGATDVLITGAVCGPGSVPVPAPYLVVLEEVLAGRARPEDLISSDPTFFATRCVDEDTGELSQRSLIEEESFSFTVPVRLPETPTEPGNRKPRLVDPPREGTSAFLLGQGVNCDPGFDYENGPGLESALAAWPETDATGCDDPAFPDAARLPFDAGNVCLAVRVVEPMDGEEAMELFDPDGDGLCVDPEAPPPSTRPPSDLPPEWETLSLAVYTDAGELERLFSNFEASPLTVVETPPPDPPEAVIVRNPAFVEWTRPDPATIPPEGLRVDFVFVLRDRRAGMDVARRTLCLLPPAD